MAKMFNVSLDRFRQQCDSLTFDFEPRSYVTMCGRPPTKEIPERIAPLLYELTKDQGVFIVHPGMEEKDIKAQERQALLRYLGGALHERIKNYISEEDDFKRKGVTLKRNKHFENALRYQKEIREMLEMEAPIEEELSFFDAERRKALGVDGRNIQHVASGLFDPDTVVVTDTQTEFEKSEPKKPAPTSFKDVSSGEILAG